VTYTFEKFEQIKMKKPLITKQEMMLVTDTITGAVETANVKVSVHVQRDTPKFKGEAFTMLFQKLGVVTARNIQPITAKLLLYLCAVVDYGNIVNKGPEQIAEELGFSRRQVGRGLKELIDLKIVVTQKNASDGRMVMIYLNPYQSWKGKVIDRKKYIAATDPNQLDLFPDSKHSLVAMSKKTLDTVSVANTDFTQEQE